MAEAIHLLGLPKKHKPKDIKPQGAGSGLDADMVDGKHASELGGGGGAPADASYVTINAETGLSNETRHQDILEANKHSPKAHDINPDEGPHTGGLPLGKIEGHTKSVHDALSIDAATLEGSNKAGVQDHDPKNHGDPAHTETYEKTGNKGQASGYCELDGSAEVPLSRIKATLTGKDADSVDGKEPGSTSGKLAILDANGRVQDSAKLEGSTKAQVQDHDKVASVTFIIDGGGSAITTGQKGHLRIPFACTINRVTLLAGQSGSIVIDIWKDAYANFPPTDADSITGSSPPTISSAQKSEDSTLTGWTTTINADDILAFNVDSCSTITRVTLSLKVTKS